MGLLRVPIAFIVAVLVGTALSALAHTHFVLMELADVGVNVSLSDRLSTHLHDLIAFLPSYDPVAGVPSMGIIMGVGFLLAFIIAAIVIRFLPGLRTIGYTLAGGVALWAMLSLMQQQFGTMPIAGARTTLGLALQVAAGAVGGLTFSALSRSD